MPNRGPVSDLTSNFILELFQVLTSSQVRAEVGTQVGP
jgi:hypothetical protein